MLKCVRIAPFGKPVVPDVYRMAAMSSSATGAQAGSGACRTKEDQGVAPPARVSVWTRCCSAGVSSAGGTSVCSSASWISSRASQSCRM